MVLYDAIVVLYVWLRCLVMRHDFENGITVFTEHGMHRRCDRCGRLSAGWHGIGVLR